MQIHERQAIIGKIYIRLGRLPDWQLVLLEWLSSVLSRPLRPGRPSQSGDR